MTFRFTTTAADLKEARRVLNPRPAADSIQARRKHLRGLYGWILFIALAVMIFLLLQDHPVRHSLLRPHHPVPPQAASGHAEAVAVAARWALIISVPLLFLSAYAAIGVSRRSGRGVEMVVTVEEDGLRFVRPLKRERLFWAGFTSMAETDHLFVLRETKLSCRVVAKRAMTPDEVTAFRERLADKLIPPPAAGGAA